MGNYSIPVWQMIVKSIPDDGKSKNFLQSSEIQKLVLKRYSNENVNPRTIGLQTIFHCIDHPGNKHGGGLHLKTPLFTTNGKGGFKLLTEKEKTQFLKKLSNN